ncbi:taf11p [Saccharomyces arboricola H-6]|uniref:Taf11p n=1 Tax=Saccharomyces arboricola (strain H-6 / AS 2.3317 / CBS 10644) TaxID=1160507 RepID=J8Q476_SACAR|nr:taf11p [Saccharomyces arboricola H-6]
MNEPQGPLDSIPKVNYPPILTIANYFSTKQMIDQVISEDQDYVTWKLQNLRTGGTPINNQLNKYPKYKYKKKKISQQDPDSINKVPEELIFPQDILRKQTQNNKYEEANENDDKDDNDEKLTQDEQFKLLVTNLDKDQTNRFEVFHRTSLNKTQVKKLASTVTNQTVSENIRVFLQAIGKIYAGEIIELAMVVKNKWLTSQMCIEFDKRTKIGRKLKKYLKKLTFSIIENQQYKQDYQSDSVPEDEPDFYFDDEEVDKRETMLGNSLLQSKYLQQSDNHSQDLKLQLIEQYNKLVLQFNKLDVSIEKYNNSPILPEHVREAWRLYRLQSDTLPNAYWRTQGEGQGSMFR